MIFKRTDGKDQDFVENCRLLDMDLDRRVGKKIQREKYNKYNQNLHQLSQVLLREISINCNSHN